MGGFLERFTKPNPDTQRIIDAEKARIQAEGATVSAGMAREFADRRATIDNAHAQRIAPIDAQIAGLQQDRIAMQRQGILNLVFGQLRVNLISALTRRATDRAAMDRMRTEIESRLNDLRTNPDVHLSDVETWALSNVADDEPLKDKIRLAFSTFKTEMEKHGATVE